MIAALPKSKVAHSSKLKKEQANSAKQAVSVEPRSKKKEGLEQNTFDFMEAENQRGIFGDLPSRNIYAGEDLDVPAYLRRGVKIAI